MISQEQAEQIVKIALSCLGQPYRDIFKCTDFVRQAYNQVGLTIPPPTLNLKLDDMHSPPIGFVLYLKRKASQVDRRVTHAVLILPERKCIHASYYLGITIVITELDELLKMYDLASQQVNQKTPSREGAFLYFGD